jgi:hypothetical protein
MADVPWLGASANLTFLGISVLKTNVGKCFSSSSRTSLAKVVSHINHCPDNSKHPVVCEVFVFKCVNGVYK